MNRNQVMPLPPEGERLRFALVYQAGLANVFQVNCFNLNPFGRNARRVLQCDFRSCEFFAHGLAQAGAIVMTLACNQAGEIADAIWSDDLEEQPFSDKFRPVFYTRGF